MIKCFNVVVKVFEVSCQEDSCTETIVVNSWRDAEKYGWCVPIDGGLQMCPKCHKAYKERIFATAISPEEYKKKYMVGKN